MMKKLKIWVKAFRLRTLPLSLSSVLTASSLAVYYNVFEISVFLMIITTTVLLQILSNLANDYGDATKGTDNDNRIGPKRSIQSQEITPQQMLKAVVITAILSFISGLVLIYIAFQKNDLYYVLLFFLLGLASILAAVKYTMGKNAYGYSGMGDIFVFLFFGLVGVVGGYFLYGHSVVIEVVFASITIGLLSTAVLNMNNMRDEDNDAKCNKNTVVVLLGGSIAKYYHFSLILLSFISWVVLLYKLHSPILYISLFPFWVLFKNAFFVLHNTDKQLFDSELKKIALSTFFISLLFFVGVYWSRVN